MSELTLLIFRIGFLALLWVFIFIVIYSVRSDLFGPKLPKSLQQAAASAGAQKTAPAPAASPEAATTVTPRVQARPASAAGATRESARRIVITDGPKAGLELELPVTGLSIGRSSSSGLQIRDDYTSNAHAKIMLWRDEWMLQDLDSTNGTFLAGKRVTVPTPIPVHTPIKIGTTTFELRA